MDKHYDRWSRLAPLGLMVVGMGMSLLGEAIIMKGEGRPTRKWVLMGALALIVVNLGLSIFGGAVKERTLYEMLVKNPHLNDR